MEIVTLSPKFRSNSFFINYTVATNLLLFIFFKNVCQGTFSKHGIVLLLVVCEPDPKWRKKPKQFYNHTLDLISENEVSLLFIILVIIQIFQSFCNSRLSMIFWSKVFKAQGVMLTYTIYGREHNTHNIACKDCNIRSSA